MKYIKKIESFIDSSTNLRCWKIPTKQPDILIALKKLENKEWCDFTLDDLLNIYGGYLYELKHVYIIKIESYDSEHITVFKEWTTVTTILKIKQRFKGQNVIIEDRGVIKVSKKEIEEYILEQDAKKYNL